MLRQFRKTDRKRATTIVAAVVTIPLFLGLAALAVDVGYMVVIHSDLQHAADSAALAAADLLPDDDDLYSNVDYYSQVNHSGHGVIVQVGDLEVGNWDVDAREFNVGMTPYDAVKVTTRRMGSNGNAVSLFFAKIFGIVETDLSATAVAYHPYSGVRFLIDDEMIDADIPVIQDLAGDLGVSPDDLISDEDDDHFIDLPPGETLELPTGQVGDEALFAVGSDFPYRRTTDPSVQDFLLYNTSGPKYGIKSGDLDPLPGVDPMSDPTKYPSFVNSYQVHVSPVYKSDVSNTSPWVNATGERRGLLAFKIVGIGSDPDGAGSKLPNIIIQIADPATIDLSKSDLILDNRSGTSMLVE